MWHDGFPNVVNKWYMCLVEGQEVPLYLIHCSKTGSNRWLMDDGKTYAEIDEEVKYGEQIQYVPTFNRF